MSADTQNSESETKHWHAKIKSLPEITSEKIRIFLEATSTAKETSSSGYKLHVDDLLFDFEVCTSDNIHAMRCKCLQSLKTDSPPYDVYVEMNHLANITNWTCTCGASQRPCHHVVSIIHRLEHYQRLNLKAVPSAASKTSRAKARRFPQKPYEGSGRPVQEIIVQGPGKGSDSQGLRSTLYNPIRTSLGKINLPLLLCPFFDMLEERKRPLYSQIWSVNENVEMVNSKYGLVPKGSPLSYQQPCETNVPVSDVLQATSVNDAP